VKRLLLLVASHGAVLAAGFVLGVYLLPILIAPPAPSNAELQGMASGASFSGAFRRDLKDSDFLHWGEGRVFVGPTAVGLMGRVAPGPNYKLYLSPRFIETEAEFARLKPELLQVGDIKSFENFVVPLPAGVDLTRYNSVVVWCEAFSQFITAAQYR
jgi:hypothetical protein